MMSGIAKGATTNKSGVSMDDNNPSPTDQERFNKNVWDDNLDEVIALIKRLTDNDRFNDKGEWKPNANRWAWIHNNRCKYISLRIDMRNGGFVILDRDGERISLAQLEYQDK
jgi:hypothetical protein